MEGAADSHKRTPKPTAKAVEGKLNRLKNERKGKLTQLTRKRKEIEILKKNKVNAQLIKEEVLFIFGKFFREFKELNAEILPLLEDKDKEEDQSNWYMTKCVEFEDFVQETEDWIERVMTSPKEDNVDDDDDVQPSDSISEVISPTTKIRKTSLVITHKCLTQVVLV